MLRVQERVVALLAEIDEICRGKQIEYSLTENTANMAAHAGGFTNNEYLAEIVMKPADYVRFSDAVKASAPKDRVLEDLSNDPEMDGFFGRYVDTSTTLWDMTAGNQYQHKGIYVRIWILRGKEDFGRVFDTFEKMTQMNSLTYPEFWLAYGQDKTKKLTKGLLTSRKLLRRRSPARKNFAKITGNDISGEKKYWYKVDRKTKRTIDAAITSETKRISFEGIELSIYSDHEKLIKAVSGEAKLQESDYPANGRGIEIDTAITFEELIRQAKAAGIDPEAAARSKADYDAFVSYQVGPEKKAADADWRFVKRTIQRFELWQEMSPRKEEIKELYEEGRVDELREIFRTYDEYTRYYYKWKMGFMFDKELFDIYCDIVDQKDKAEYVKKLKAMMPEEFYEDLSEYVNKNCG
ncbi:MAG: hypothetical protein Q4A65_01945 [Bacillota bacterium]|nr:hypothetical protein [Bacillota bacterium]